MESWSYKDNKKLYITGGLALGSVLIYSIRWMLQRFKNTKLTPWIEEYLGEVKERYKELNKKPNVEFVAYIMNLSTELQQYLFSIDHSDLENERIKNINNEKAYEDLVAETVELYEKYYLAASGIIKSRTGIDMDQFGQTLQGFDQREIKEASKTQKKDYFETELPLIDKDKLREAYIFYAKTYTQHARIASEQMVLAQRKQEYQEIAFKTIFQNKFLLKDLIKSKYGIDQKYFDQLIKNSGLLDDNEIRYYYEDVKRAFTI